MRQRLVRDIYSGQVHRLPPGASVNEAACLMADRHIGAVLVMAQEDLLGIFTERDLLNRIVAPGLHPVDVTLSQAMTANPVVIGPQTKAVDALRLMREGGFRHLPVRQDGRVIGMISLRDFIAVEYAAVEQQLDFETAIAEGH